MTSYRGGLKSVFIAMVRSRRPNRTLQSAVKIRRSVSTLRQTPVFRLGIVEGLIWLFFIAGSAYAEPVLQTDSFALYMDTYLRQDLITFKNIIDLDSHNRDDVTTYLGIDYSLGLKSEFKDSGTALYLKLERNGPYDYGAPLFVHNTLMNSGGVIEKYRNDELLPELEEFWLDASLFKPFKFKVGLYTYEVGNGFSLNGGYENYGFTISRESEGSIWRLYYCRPDASHKNHLGPRIRQDEEQGIDYNHGVANFFATDAKFKIREGYVWPYVGVLADYTSSGKRDSSFTAPIKRDTLGTLGLVFKWEGDKISWSTELAHNFGQAESEDPQYKNVQHTGYLAYTGLDYRAGKFTHYFKFLLGSGNKATPDTAINGETTFANGKNKAFSYYSPLNNKLFDSVSSSNVDMLPIVAMGGGYGLNYGIRRPGSFSAGDFDNLIMPCLGSDFALSDKLNIGIYGYYLRSFERGVGTFGGEAKYLSYDLGWEADLFIDYKINEIFTIEFLGGYFLPGRYYRQERDDTLDSLFSPYIRGDGNANSAYQIELALTLEL